MPRDKEKGKPKGFAFIMYEDQRSTVLAIDNLNGATVIDKTLRVDHVSQYKQKRTKNDDGEWEEPEQQSLNARPDMIRGAYSSLSLGRKTSSPFNPDFSSDGLPDDDDESVSSAASIDPEDPMRDYLLAKRREEKAKSKSKKSKKHEGETPEERKVRKEKKRAKREAKARSKPSEKEASRSRRADSPPRRTERQRTRSRSPVRPSKSGHDRERSHGHRDRS